ncbi:MAG TPA: glycosyltransferase family 2 protein [Bacteroidia bacterium]|nr:glycosyltransferase family 2 protein [Bacteroidia bacterium]
MADGINTPLISVVSPVYLAEKIVDELVSRIDREVSKISGNYEIILVEDGSPDKSWEKIEENCLKNKNVVGIKLSRNFGQHYAITAGLAQSRGDYVVLMDCDLQDPPEEIINLYNKAKDGFDIVLGKRSERKDTFFKKLFGKFFYFLLGYLTETKIDNTIGAFRIMSRAVVNSFCSMKEYNRFFGGMIGWLGFKTASVNVQHAPRASGKTSYNFNKLINLALNAAVSFSDKPLRLAIKLGFGLTVLSGLYIFYIVMINIIFGTSAVGWTSLIASVFFSTGLVITLLGVIGLYIGKIFEEVKRRPLYVIEKIVKKG